MLAMSKFNNVFSSAARKLLSTFGEESPATYQVKDGGSITLTVAIDRDVKDSESIGTFVNLVTTISWMNEDLSTHSKKDSITLATGETFNLNKLIENDGVIVTYQVLKA